jgi:hypothetical protein
MTTSQFADPEIRVRNIESPGRFSTWRICQNLTDRWGEINNFDAEHKPLGELADTTGLLDRLREQMVDEITFVVRKDGRFGILFEIEYASKESETASGEKDMRCYLPHTEVLANLVDSVKKLQQQFPVIDWAIPDETEICNDRLALWGFFPDGALTEEQRRDVATAIYGLDLYRM